MKRNFSRAIFIVIIFSTFANIFGQERVIDEKEYREILSKATENLKNKTYRLTTTNKTFSDRNANPERVEINITEVVQPDKRRYVYELKSLTENTKTESIWISEKGYIRENDGAWEEISRGTGRGNGNGDSREITVSYKFIEKTNLNNQPANVYEMEMNQTATKFTQNSRFEVQYIGRTRYWISEDGRLLKIVSEVETVSSKSFVRDTSIYEYDSSIKIKAPIIKTATKRNPK